MTDWVCPKCGKTRWHRENDDYSEGYKSLLCVGCRIEEHARLRRRRLDMTGQEDTMTKFACPKCGNTRWQIDWDERPEALYATCTTCGYEHYYSAGDEGPIVQIEQPELEETT